MTLPEWVVLHVPHDSTLVPDTVRDQFTLGDAALSREMLRMTDHHTHALFAEDQSHIRVVRAPVSRLVVDVERFADDGDEPMAARGMGAVYTRTADGEPLRRALTPSERAGLLRSWYAPHHARLEHVVGEVLDRHGRCLVVDCHSFPSVALPYEQASPERHRPAICIGTDPFHTPPALAEAFVAAFEEAFDDVAVDDPFTGALVPTSRYRTDARVMGVMVEVNRGRYLDERSGQRSAAFEGCRAALRGAIGRALSTFAATGPASADDRADSHAGFLPGRTVS